MYITCLLTLIMLAPEDYGSHSVCLCQSVCLSVTTLSALPAAIRVLNPDLIHLSRWIDQIRIQSGFNCNWITCELDRSRFNLDSGVHVKHGLSLPATSIYVHSITHNVTSHACSYDVLFIDSKYTTLSTTLTSTVLLLYLISFILEGAYEFLCLSSRIQPSRCRRKALILRSRDQ